MLYHQNKTGMKREKRPSIHFLSFFLFPFLDYSPTTATKMATMMMVVVKVLINGEKSNLVVCMAVVTSGDLTVMFDTGVVLSVFISCTSFCLWSRFTHGKGGTSVRNSYMLSYRTVCKFID